MKLLGIYRHPQFSNNAIEADRLILEASLAEIQRLAPSPLRIATIEETEVPGTRGAYDLVLTMAQSEEALAALEQNFGHSPIWNSPAAIRNCYRKNMSRLLSEAAVGYVPYRLLATHETAPSISQGEALWLKRSDFHAICDADVCLAENTAEAEARLAAFRQRGVAEVILQRHVPGDIYKFYGVRGRFFHPVQVRSFLPGGQPSPDFSALEGAAHRSAEALGLEIYGGDAILDADGHFHLIDVNDWPSFRLCREAAAGAIAANALAFLAEKKTRREPAASRSFA